MAVDLAKKPHILVVHGVQHGSNSSISADEKIKRLVDGSLAKLGITRQFKVKQYLYEDISDDHPTTVLSKTICKAIASKSPLKGKPLQAVVDIVMDVVFAISHGSVANQVRTGLRNAILESHQAGHRVLIAAHSLGSFYSLQVINELIKEGDTFRGDDRRLWATQGLITFGSPVGLNQPIGPLHLFPEVAIRKIPSKVDVLPWVNFYSRFDPVVSGEVFGKKVSVRGSEGPVEARYRGATNSARWNLRGVYLDSATRWLVAHTAYWRQRQLGDRMLEMLWG